MRAHKIIQKFDSAKVEVRLSPTDIEALFDDYAANWPKHGTENAVDVCLAYADHTRLCAMLGAGWQRVVDAWAPVFAQVTYGDGGYSHPDPVRELNRRLAEITNTLEFVQ